MKKALPLLSTISLSVLMAACSHNGDGQASHQPSPQEMQRWQTAQQEHMRKVSEYFFDEMDANQDGVVSYKEFMAFQRKVFREADVNHDGKLTLGEFIGEGKRQKEHIHEWKKEQREENRDDDRVQRDDDRDNAAGQNEGYDDNNGARSGNYGGQRSDYDENGDSQR